MLTVSDTESDISALRTRVAVLEERVASAHLAVNKAEMAMDKRLEGMNEFREALQAQSNTFPTRELMDEKIDVINVRLGGLDTRVSRSEGKAAAYSVAVGTLVAILAIVLRFVN